MGSHRSLRFRPHTKLSLDMLLECYKIRPNQLPVKGPYLYAGNFYSSFRGLGFSLPTRSHSGLSVADAADKFEGFVFAEGRFEFRESGARPIADSDTCDECKLFVQCRPQYGQHDAGCETSVVVSIRRKQRDLCCGQGLDHAER